MAALRLLRDDAVALDVGGRTVHLSSLGRVLWPAYGYTKAHMLDYHVRVAPVLLPHLAGRPLTLHRFPEGVGGPHFFQTRIPPPSRRGRRPDDHVGAPRQGVRGLEPERRRQVHRRAVFAAPDDVHHRIAAHGDLFAPMLELRQRLPAGSLD